MPVLGFNFTKLFIERKKPSYNKITINSNLNIQDIKEVKSNLFSKPTLIFEFDFNIDYKPDIANINLKGSLLYTTTEDLHKKILDEWKQKKVNDKIKQIIFNTILTKCNLKALQLEEEFSLPYHIPLPRYKIESESTENTKTENTRDKKTQDKKK
jgi:hypothetical protein